MYLLLYLGSIPNLFYTSFPCPLKQKYFVWKGAQLLHHYMSIQAYMYRHESVSIIHLHHALVFTDITTRKKQSKVIYWYTGLLFLTYYAVKSLGIRHENMTWNYCADSEWFNNNKMIFFSEKLDHKYEHRIWCNIKHLIKILINIKKACISGKVRSWNIEKKNAILSPTPPTKREWKPYYSFPWIL